MSTRVLVTLDGTVLDAEEPVLCADDLGAVRGDGVFETVLVRGGAACLIEPHLDRLAASAAALGIPQPDRDDWRFATEVAVTEWGSELDGVMRWFLSRGRESGGDPTSLVTVAPVAARVERARSEGVSVMTLPAGKSVDMVHLAPWQLAGAKTLSYAVNMAALRYAENRGAQDVIFVSSERFVLEGPRSTVVTVTGKSMVSPPAEHGVLNGTTTAALFEVAGKKGFTCEYAPVRPADLIVADSVWLISSITLAARVNSLDGLALRPTAVDDDVRTMVELAVETVGRG